MVVTSYYTVGGEIVAETSGGTRLDYLSDALGSVTAKIDEGFVVVTTARYTPYGDLHTGSSHKFGWVGSRGYRASINGFYVRARHFSMQSGGWTSVDPFWPVEPAYHCANGNPVVFIDADGRDPVIAHRILMKHPVSHEIMFRAMGCGYVEIWWQYKLTPEKGVNGWLIQKVTSYYDITKCDPNKEVDPPCPQTVFEAWPVRNGKVYRPSNPKPPPYNWVPPSENSAGDQWARQDRGLCTSGSQSVHGELMFLASEDTETLPQGFTPGGAPCTNGLPSTTSYSGFKPLSKGQGDMSVIWGCCKLSKGDHCVYPNPECEKCDFPCRCLGSIGNHDP